ncbi:MAG: hypothetical protein O2861_03750 [Proteobacteria bacterium]|nr:hypothetical protein [Pseudomonadota bacterium]
MTKSSLFACFLLSPIFFGSSLLAQDIPDIEELMTAEELRATGVDGLSNAEKRALNAWLQRFRDGEISAAIEEAVAEAPVSTDTGARVIRTEPEDVYPPPRESQEILSRIAGEFNGWEGRTRFTLENGQVWEQRRSSRWKVSLQSPEVRLYQNFLGAWEMEVVAEDRAIGVRRIR